MTAGLPNNVTRFTASCIARVLIEKPRWVGLRFGFPHLVSFDAFVITQFGLALEEELNVKTNKQPPNLSLGRIFSGCSSLANLQLIVPGS